MKKFLGVIRLGHRVLVFLLITIIFLSGCTFSGDARQMIDQILDQVAPLAPAVTETVVSTQTTVSEVTPQPTLSPTPQDLGPTELIVWVPPQFDPQLDTPEAGLMRSQIAEFEAQNQDVFVRVRVKAESGPTGLLESLTITSAAATEAVPALIALPRSLLEEAVTRQLIHPIDSFSTRIDDDDWYDYARRLTLIEGSNYGLPFAGDALLLVYRQNVVGTAPVTWEDILKRGEPLSFPAADPQALVTLNLYLSAKGGFEDAQRHLELDQEILNQVLTLYENGSKSGVFPLWLTQFQKNADAWTAYNELRSNLTIVWASNYLKSMPPDSSAVAVPSFSETPFSLADGWVWCLADPYPERHALSVSLAEFLVQPDFLDNWSVEAGVFPVRPSSLQSWNNPQLSVLLGQVALSAQIRPKNEVILTVGPVFADGVLQVLSSKTPAAEAAQNIIEKIGNP
ncbi:MAG: hypothetical protein CL609_24630 [Anaerolineaceae bacterium]|nr:hypothetical protein [Anaerolineaceae bacterium]